MDWYLRQLLSDVYVIFFMLFGEEYQVLLSFRVS